MLEPPTITPEAIAACVHTAYAIDLKHIAFLPLGADSNTAVYKALAADSTPYFVKLRRGEFDSVAVTVPKLLSDAGITAIIPPVGTVDDTLWAHVEQFALVIYPFVNGQNAYRVSLSPQQWHAFGQAIQRLHSTSLPPAIVQRIPHETYPADARIRLAQTSAQLDTMPPPDEVAKRLLAFLQEHRAEIRDMLARTEHLAHTLRSRQPALVTCHGDLHAGNIFLGDDGQLHTVDWDTLISAPKERDLMFIGGAQGFIGTTPQNETRLFFSGYGATAIDLTALAYYRYERIIQDMAIYCDELLLSSAGGADRAPSLHYLMANFLPGGTIERANAAWEAL